jgi:uncharacterized protein
VAKHPQPRIKHVPLRTCIGCRTVLPKRDLIRIVRTEHGLVVDATGKVAGRGAYVHNVRTCWEQALRGPINRALRMELAPADMEVLAAYIQKLPREDKTELSGNKG